MLAMLLAALRQCEADVQASTHFVFGSRLHTHLAEVAAAPQVVQCGGGALRAAAVGAWDDLHMATWRMPRTGGTSASADTGRLWRLQRQWRRSTPALYREVRRRSPDGPAAAGAHLSHQLRPGLPLRQRPVRQPQRLAQVEGIARAVPAPVVKSVGPMRQDAMHSGHSRHSASPRSSGLLDRYLHRCQASGSHESGCIAQQAQQAHRRAQVQQMFERYRGSAQLLCV